MADMDDSYTPTPTSNTTTATSTSDTTSLPTSFTSSTTSSFSFGTASSSHAQRPHLNSTTSTSTSSTSAFPDFNFSSTSTSTSTSPSISLPSFTSPQPHKRTSEAVNGDVIDDDEDDDERGHASKRKYQREEQEDEDQDREEEEKGAMNDSSGPDDSFMDLLNIFSKLNFPEGQPEPCPLCPLTFPIKEFAAHVYKCIKQLDEVDREQQERADAQLAYKIATEVGAEEDQFFYSRNASTDEDMSTTTQRRKCKDGIRCKRVDARHFIDIEHPPVSCPICEQQYPVYELDAHITICLTQPQQPKPAFSQTSGTSFSAIAGDTNMDGSNSNSNSNSNAFSSSAFTSIRDDIAQPSPSPPLPAKIVFGEDLNDDDDRDDSKDTPIRRSASAGANIGRHQLTLEQAAAMASLVVDQQSKSAANQDYSLVDLLDTFKTLGFTQENLTNLSKTIDTNKQTTSATSPPPTTSSSQPTSSTT